MTQPPEKRLVTEARLASLVDTPAAALLTDPTSATATAVQLLISAAITALKGGASSALDTLGEIQAALGNDANLAATLTAAIAGKASPADVTAAVSAAITTPFAADIASRLPGYGQPPSSMVMLPAVGNTPAVLNFPDFTTVASTQVVQRGAAGAFDDDDVNNANVVWDPNHARWVMYYSGFSSTSGGNLVQGLGLAYATTLAGPWVKDSRNPIRPAAGSNVENGALVWIAGRWLRATENTGANTSVFETSPDLITWTAFTTTGLTRGVHDPFMRVNQFGLLELWYGNGMPNASIYRAVSTNGGATWIDATAATLGPPPLGNGTYRGNGEPSVYALPNKEGVEYIIFTDVSQANDKAMICAALTYDAGTTWTWRIISTGSGSGFDSYQKFDSMPLYAEGQFHIFHSAGTVAGSGVNLNSTIGHLAAQWTPNPRSIVSQTVIIPTVLTNITAPTITGSTTIGSVLTVTPGAWSPTPDALGYQWYRASTAISGATGTTYTTVTADLGQAITVVERATKSTFTAVTATSNSITPTASSGGGAHDPSTISGLVTLHRADSITGVADGAGVASWPDTSGNAYTATQATGSLQPTYVASAMNSKPGVRWPSAGPFFLTTNASAGNPAQTTFAVIRPAAAALATNSAIRGADAGAGLEVRVAGAVLSHLSQNTADLGSSSTTLTANTAYAVVTTYNSSTGSTFKVNGIAAGASSSTSSLDTTKKLWIGINGSQVAEGWQGDILELRTYSRVLTPTEIALLDSYAQDRYGITVADYS